MLVNAANITDKKYQKLTIQVSGNHLSFACFDSLNHQVLSFEEVSFDVTDQNIPLEQQLAHYCESNVLLNADYDDVLVLHDNNFSTFVPTALFDEEYIGSYLQYNTKVFETDFFTHDELVKHGMHAVYIPYVNLNNFFVDHFGTFTYKHVNSILVAKLLEISKNVDTKKMFVHLCDTHFEIIIVQNQHLLLFNSFEYKTPEDLIYYILFTAEQLNMNPENFVLEFLGSISEDDAYFKIVYKYVRNVSLLDVTESSDQNSFTSDENRKHFILFHS